MQLSQQQAALAVGRVLAGTRLSDALQSVGADSAGAARALVHELVYGTLRHWGTLDALTRALADKPIPEPKLAALVAVALYQIEHTKAPPFAIVDQAVDAAASIARPAARGLVNAMLRRFLRERETLLERVRAQPVARWSHPRWWVRRVRSDWPDHWERILAAGNTRPPLALRVNRRLATRDALLARFAAAGIAALAEGACGIIVDAPRPVQELPGYADGEFAVQDLGAQLAAPLLGASDGMRVLDACAAPGGKTTHVLEHAHVAMTALDSDPKRLERLRDNIRRLRLDGSNVIVAAGDATDAATWWDGVAFDRILADVPCTASGVTRRHPDAKWQRRATDVASFRAQQRAILDALWPLLVSGGRLLYVTCSVFREENDDRIAEFLALHADSLREPITFPPAVAHSGGQLLPSADGEGHNQDGFYYALLRKA